MTILDRTRPFARLITALATLALAVACGGGGGPTSGSTPSPVTGGLTSGLIAFVSTKGVGVLDPATGSSTIIAPLPAGAAFRVSGPVWAPAPGSSDEVIYFTIHDDRPAERRTTPGVVPYDWLFMVNPFTGVIEPIAAAPDMQSEGPFGLTANSHYLAMTVGCCTSYEVDALDLTKPVTGLKVLVRSDQATLFTQGAAPGSDGRIAVRAFATGAWYWLNPGAGVLQPFPLKLGPDDGPIAISNNGQMVAVSMPDKGAYIEPINVSVPVASASSSASAAASPSPQPSATPRRVNSKLPHADALAWSPDSAQLALAVSGQVQIYDAAGKDGTPPVHKYLAGGGVTGIDWSGPLVGASLSQAKPSKGPQPFVDALLASTKLPAAADTPAMRPLTKVYMWQFDSSRTSPLSSIAEATAAVLQEHPPMPAGVVFHHWAPSGTWAFLGGCYRYRVVIAGSIAPKASTVGLLSNDLCSQPKASPSPS